MARRSRRVDPDGVLDPDRGGSSVATVKQAEEIAGIDATRRDRDRQGARELDDRVETMPGLTRQQRDRERALPRDTTGEVPDPRMERRLPAVDTVRQPLSSRQRKARSVTKRGTQDRLPATQYQATADLIGRPEHWHQLNQALSDATGDVQALGDAQRTEVQRVDRAIQAYERANDRGHVLYSNVQMPGAVNRTSLAPYVARNFSTGRVVDFDRYTMSTHTVHEIDLEQPAADRTAVFEIQTRRGMYLGRSDSLDDTAHLLPRGLRLRVAGTHTATYRRPDGSTGSRQVIQLVDIVEPPS